MGKYYKQKECKYQEKSTKQLNCIRDWIFIIISSLMSEWLIPYLYAIIEVMGTLIPVSVFQLKVNYVLINTYYYYMQKLIIKCNVLISSYAI